MLFRSYPKFKINSSTCKEIRNIDSLNEELKKDYNLVVLDYNNVKGAFTDARVDRAGKFEVANGGTLFLDEIGNLPLHLQAKLLTALQSNNIVRVGSNKPQKIDIRLICATNKDLPQMVEQTSFREDLLYRILLMKYLLLQILYLIKMEEMVPLENL